MSMHIMFMVSKYIIYVLADFCDQIPLSFNDKTLSLDKFPSGDVLSAGIKLFTFSKVSAEEFKEKLAGSISILHTR